MTDVDRRRLPGLGPYARTQAVPQGFICVDPIWVHTDGRITARYEHADGSEMFVRLRDTATGELLSVPAE